MLDYIINVVTYLDGAVVVGEWGEGSRGVLWYMDRECTWTPPH